MAESPPDGVTICRYCFAPLGNKPVQGRLNGWTVWYCQERCKKAEGRSGEEARAGVVAASRLDRPSLLDRPAIENVVDGEQGGLFE